MSKYGLGLARYDSIHTLAAIAFVLENNYASATDENFGDFLSAYSDIDDSLASLFIHMEIEISGSDALVAAIQRHPDRWRKVLEHLDRLRRTIAWAFDAPIDEGDEP